MMNRMKKIAVRAYESPLCPLLVFTLMMLLAHRFMYTNYGDDAVYNKVFSSTLKDKGLLEVIKYGYHISKENFIRYPYSTIYYFIRKICGGVLWRPCIALSYPVIALSMFLVFCKQNNTLNKKQKMILAICVVLYIPISIMSETGWLSTSIVYVLPVAVCMIAAVGIRSAFYREKERWYKYLLFSIILFIGTSHEQLSALIFGILLVLELWYVIAYKKINWGVMLYLCISGIQTYRALTYPGNDARRYREAVAYFPDYFSLDLIDKVYLGYIDTMKIVMTKYIVPFTLLALLIAIVIWLEYSQLVFRIISLIPIVIMIVYGIRPSFLSGITSNLVTFSLDDTIDINNFYNIQLDVGLFLSLLLVGSLMICIYIAFGNSFESYFYGFLFLGGMCTRFIMGLSASLYVSGNRTCYVMFICIAIIIYALLNKLSIIVSVKTMSYISMAVIIGACILYFDLLAFI